MRDATDAFARQIIEDHHAAWSRGDIPAMLSNYHEDAELILNTGGPDGGPLRLMGKGELEAFLTSASSAVASRTKVVHFTFRDGVARTLIQAHVRHKLTGHTLQGTFRQVIQFDGQKILSSHEFHDAALLQAFWKMIEGENEHPPEDLEDR